MIAYDALTHCGSAAIAQSRTILPARRTLRPTNWKITQSVMWREQRCIGVEWKITNFVTLGSPLAHASFLMADGPSDLAERVSQREFPTCPPQPNDARDLQYGKPLLVAKNGGTLLHHAALFACTRWTNLYFERDIIGGAIEDILGHGITNRRLEPRRILSLHQVLEPGHRSEAAARGARPVRLVGSSKPMHRIAIRSRRTASQG